MAEITLDELKAVRDQIVTGRLPVTVSSGGRTITYSPANLDALERRIRALESGRTTIVNVRTEKGW